MRYLSRPFSRPWPRLHQLADALIPINFLLASAGIAVSSVLLWLYYNPSSPLCSEVGGCHTVATSTYAHIGPVPVAALGVAGYAFLATLSWARGSVGTAFLFACSLGGLLYSCYLTYLEAAIIHALCPWCLASQGIIATLTITSLSRFLLLDRIPSPR